MGRVTMWSRSTCSSLKSSSGAPLASSATRSEEHTSEFQSHSDLVCRLLLEKKKEKEERNQHWYKPGPANLSVVSTTTHFDTRPRGEAKTHYVDTRKKTN